MDTIVKDMKIDRELQEYRKNVEDHGKEVAGEIRTERKFTVKKCSSIALNVLRAVEELQKEALRDIRNAKRDSERRICKIEGLDEESIDPTCDSGSESECDCGYEVDCYCGVVEGRDDQIRAEFRLWPDSKDDLTCAKYGNDY